MRTLNEGRSLNPGDTIANLLPFHVKSLAQRRPESEPRRHLGTLNVVDRDVPRSTKAGV